MKIKKMFFSKGISAYFTDDQRAIKNGARHDGFIYTGQPLTDGFDAIRIAGESISVGIITQDGHCVFGDCCAVQYSGAGGRDPVFRADHYIPVLKNTVAPALCEKVFANFKEAARYLDILRSANGSKLHTALRYGVSQALLAAFAADRKKTMTEIIAEEYLLPLVPEPVKILGQCGDDRYDNTDKMIIKKVDILPHGLINSVQEKFGEDGELFVDYVGWVRERILKLRADESYTPELYFDVYGLPGMVFDNDIKKILQFMSVLADTASPFKLRIEGPLDAEGRHEQMMLMKKLTEGVDELEIPIELVADEWCNTLDDIDFFSRNKAGHMLQIKTPDLGGLDASIDAVLLCRNRGVKAYLGGTCNETDLSARACTHAAMATRPAQILAKPGMGFDEGYMTVHNEMKRIITMMSS